MIGVIIGVRRENALSILDVHYIYIYIFFNIYISAIQMKNEIIL